MNAQCELNAVISNGKPDGIILNTVLYGVTARISNLYCLVLRKGQ
jgi:hypothetical protein